MDKKKNIIGSEYYLLDGSYSRCLSNPGKSCPRAAPCNGYLLIPLKIVSTPFLISKADGHSTIHLKFVIATDEHGETYSCIFNDRGLITHKNTLNKLRLEMQEKLRWSIEFGFLSYQKR